MVGLLCAPSVGLETTLLKPPAATAGCGDWLAGHDDHFAMDAASLAFLPQNDLQTPAKTTPVMPAADRDQPLPRCRGPLCDRHPAPLPGPEQPGFNRMIPSEWGDWHPERASLETGAGARMSSAPQTNAGRDDPGRLERPPRTV